jgi:serine protease inhibitor
MKRFATLSLAAILLLSLSACTVRQPGNAVAAVELAAPAYPAGIGFSDMDALRANREKNPVSEESKKGIDQFSYNTAALILKDVEINGCYSPLSLYFSLSLACSGANGKTREELLALLDMSDQARLSGQSGNLYRLLYTDNEMTQLKIANSLWLDKEYQGQPVLYKENFTQNAAAQFYASVFSVDFAKESAGQAMAKWIADNTNNRMKPEFKLNPEQIMSIINRT